MMTFNRYFVGARGEKVVIMTHPGEMTKEQAFNLAAWLVAVATPLPGDLEFGDMIEAVEKGEG